MPVAEPEIFDLSNCECCATTVECGTCIDPAPAVIDADLPTIDSLPEGCDICADHSGQTVPLAIQSSGETGCCWIFEDTCGEGLEQQCMFVLFCLGLSGGDLIASAEIETNRCGFPPGSTDKVWIKNLGPAAAIDCNNLTVNFTGADVTQNQFGGPCDSIGDDLTIRF